MNSLATAAMIWGIVASVLSIVGGILIYFLFVKKKEDPKGGKFLLWLKKFLAFDRMVVEDVIKITYIIVALFITLSSFSSLGLPGGFWLFLVQIVLGNLIVRVLYEFSLVVIMIWSSLTKIKENVAEIAGATKKPAAKKEKSEK